MFYNNNHNYYNNNDNNNSRHVQAARNRNRYGVAATSLPGRKGNTAAQ